MTFIHSENDMALLSKHYLLLSSMCDINEVFKAVFLNYGSVKITVFMFNPYFKEQYVTFKNLKPANKNFLRKHPF
jgi:hypothetical protein